MTVNVCMIAKDRPRLTQQAIQSLTLNTPKELYNLTVIDDASHVPYEDGEVENMLPDGNAVCVRLSRSKGIVGFVRNLSIRISEQYWGRGDFLYLTDNDIFFKPGWLESMISTYEIGEQAGVPLRILGGVRHPYHGVNRQFETISLTDAVAGYSHLMRWETYERYGPYPQNQIGVCCSEDWWLCNEIVKDGGLVGYIEPGVLINAGLTNTLGKPAVGSEAFPKYEGIVQE